MVFGLTIGLSVAFAIFVKYREVIQLPPPVAQQPASMVAPVMASNVAAYEAMQKAFWAALAGGGTTSSADTSRDPETPEP